MSPGKEVKPSKLMVIKTSTDNYENLYRLDILGVTDRISDEGTVHHKFKEQLRKDKNKGWYKTGLIWKDNCSTLTSNQSRSLGKLRKLLRNLQKNKKLFELYGQLIQEQLAEGVIERVTEEENFGQREFYLPHKTVIRDNAKSTNLRIVYDMSARENIRSIVNEQLFGDKSCPSKLPMECINQKKIQPKSSVWRSLKGIPSNKNQDRRL